VKPGKNTPDKFNPELPFIKISPAGEKEKDSYFTITSTGDVTSPTLIRYLHTRKIDIGIAKHYLREIRFKPRGQIKGKRNVKDVLPGDALICQTVVFNPGDHDERFPTYQQTAILA
jgi:hypothetical protein